MLRQKQASEDGSGPYAKNEISDAGCPGKCCRPDRPGSQVPADCIGADKRLKLFGFVHVLSLWSSAGWRKKEEISVMTGGATERCCAYQSFLKMVAARLR